MNVSKSFAAASAFALAALTAAAPASAQATRTWVSGVGDDANPCSRTAPCKTFVGAITKTAAGGEINCIDPGGFGPVTINKSITIDCTGTYAAILASGTNAIVINDQGAGTAKVILRGLALNGATTGLAGIRFLSGGSLLVENVLVEGFSGTTIATGISIVPTTSASVTLNNVTISHNGTASAGGGVTVQPQGTANVRAFLNDVRITHNLNVGVQMISTGNTGTGNMLTLNRSEVSHNGYGLAAVTPPSTASNLLTVIATPIQYNVGYGILANGGGAQARVIGSTISGNDIGLKVANGGVVVSAGDNWLLGNTTSDGSFSSTVTKQ